MVENTQTVGQLSKYHATTKLIKCDIVIFSDWPDNILSGWIQTGIGSVPNPPSACLSWKN